MEAKWEFAVARMCLIWDNGRTVRRIVPLVDVFGSV